MEGDEFSPLQGPDYTFSSIVTIKREKSFCIQNNTSYYNLIYMRE